MAYIPFIVIKARKFSLLFSLGSLFTVFRSVRITIKGITSA
jgi:hypothetical protein